MPSHLLASGLMHYIRGSPYAERETYEVKQRRQHGVSLFLAIHGMR